MRQKLLPLIRWETPYLAIFQETFRSPALDRYFAITANLGTHTFFMVGLPILFWCGWSPFGYGLVHILALGVFWTGFVKDMLSLPRPLSPPLSRITMSGHVSLEYGFPSTHSTNAVSVAVYAILCLYGPGNTFPPTTTWALAALSYFYALSITIGRLYCGMHGFLDVIVGSFLGAAIALVEFYCSSMFEAWLQASDSYLAPAMVAAAIIILVRVHPEPADDCPCFDDSVAFAGVLIGMTIGRWRFEQHSPYAHIYNGPRATFDLAALGWLTGIVRIIAGLAVIIAWREVAKPTLHKTLPHLFRVIETAGLDLPRRFFLPATKYKEVPLRQRDDNIIPSMSDLGNAVNSIRGPTRGRAVSIGPQSAADAYETLAYRERRRRESLDSEEGGLPNGRPALGRTLGGTSEYALETGSPDRAVTSGMYSSRLQEKERLMGTGTAIVSPSPERELADGEDEPVDILIGRTDELGEKEMFLALTKPRVRYDVEVVTKLVVYAGKFLLLKVYHVTHYFMLTCCYRHRMVGSGHNTDVFRVHWVRGESPAVV